MGTTWKQLADVSTSQTLTNKTLTSPVLTTPQINDTSKDHQYVFAASELVADRTVTLPLLTGADEFVFKDHAQTLTNKTLTSPTMTAPVLGTPTSGDLANCTFPTANVNTDVDVSKDNLEAALVLIDTATTIGNGVTMTAGGDFTVTGDLRVNGNDITYDATASTIGPIGQTGGGITNNLAGANFTINSGNSTGNVGSSIIFKVPQTGDSGNGTNSLVTALTITGDSNANGTVTVAGNLVASGNLTVSGTTTTVNTETINLADNAINLNSNWPAATAPDQDCGIIAYRGTGSGSGVAQAFYWDEDLKSWNVGNTESSEEFTQTAAVVCAKVMTVSTSLTQDTTDDAFGAVGHIQISSGAVYIRTE